MVHRRLSTLAWVLALVALAGPPLRAELIAHYQLDGNWTDSSGHGFDAVPNGNPNFTSGRIGQAADFDGNGDYADVAAPVTNIPPFTVAAWVRTSFLPPSGVGQDNHYALSNGGQTSSGHGFSLRLDYSADGTPQWAFSIRDTSGDGTDALSGTDTATAEWTHLVGTWDGGITPGSAHLYVDGQRVSSPAFQSLPHGGSQNLRLAGPSNVTSYLWDGLLDEIGVWNEVLTERQTGILYRVFDGDIAEFEANGRLPEPATSALSLLAALLLTARRRVKNPDVN
jgi:hypothetical protein